MRRIGYSLVLGALLIGGCSGTGGETDGGVPVTPAECLADRACPYPLVSAHRGLCGSEPENTLMAYLECQAAGVPMVEVDTRETADGVIVIMHDDTVERTTDGEVRYPGRTRVDQLTAAEFLALVVDDERCAADPEAEPRRCHPLTFEQMLTGTSAELLVDLDFKEGDPGTLGMLVTGLGMASRVLFFDSDMERLRAYRAAVPDGVVMPRGSAPADFEAMLVPAWADLDLRWAHGDAQNAAEVEAVLAPAGVRLYINAWDGDRPADIWIGAALLTDDPEASQEYLQHAWDCLAAMRAAGADGFGTDFGPQLSAHLYPEGFGR